MKSSILFVVFTLILLAYVSSQPCLPDGIEFTSQQEIDDFKTNNSHCTKIGGSVKINGNCITNLVGLNALTNIGGSLNLSNCNTLKDLRGLKSLKSIGGDLSIANIDALTNLTGLENLISIGASLVFLINDSLINLSGLKNLESIGGGLYLGVPGPGALSKIEMLPIGLVK